MRCGLIAAFDLDLGLGKEGRIPWSCSEDMRHFATRTRGSEADKNAVIMGGRTWVSLGGKPLRGRLNIVVSSTLPSADSYVLSNSLHSAISLADDHGCTTAWIIGGTRLYSEAMKSGLCDFAETTVIPLSGNDCDTFFPLEDLAPMNVLKCQSLGGDLNPLLITWSRNRDCA